MVRSFRELRLLGLQTAVFSQCPHMTIGDLDGTDLIF